MIRDWALHNVQPQSNDPFAYVLINLFTAYNDHTFTCDIDAVFGGHEQKQQGWPRLKQLVKTIVATNKLPNL